MANSSFYVGDVADGCPEIADESVDLIVTSPPYFKKNGYTDDLMEGLGGVCGRVLKPGGRAVILEFASPRSRLFRAIYYFYFLRVLPWLGGLISQRSAYQYLPDSVLGFPDRETFKGMMEQAGFVDVRIHDLTGGIAAVHVGTRKAD